MNKPLRFLINVAVVVDQAANVLLGGDPDETISSRCFKQLATCRVCRLLCAVLNLIDRDHCAKAVELDEGEHEL